MSYAPSTVAMAIKKGTLIRPSQCSKCLKHNSEVGKIEAHHPDYNKPLEVQWLCKKCHWLTHGTTKAIRSTQKGEKIAFSARFSDELYAAVKESADEMGISMNDFISFATKDFVKKTKYERIDIICRSTSKS